MKIQRFRDYFIAVPAWITRAPGWLAHNIKPGAGRREERRLEHGWQRVGKQPARWADLRTGGTIRPSSVPELSVEAV